MTVSLVVVGAAMLGLVAGSFADVSIRRWPRGGRLGAPWRPRCSVCAAPTKVRAGLPVVSWAAPGSACAACGAGVGWRRPVAELSVALGFAAMAAIWAPSSALPAMLVLVWALIVATIIDLEFQIIPNRLTLRLPVVLAPLLVGAAVMAGEPGRLWGVLGYGIGVPAVMLGFSELFRLARGQPGIGMGDIKLAVSLAMVLGYLGGWHVAVFAYSSVFAAVVVALVLLAIGRARLASRIPFGPYLALGAMLALLAGDALREGIGPTFGL